MFKGLKLTDKGILLLTSLLAGHNIQFTKIKMGDGTAPTSITSLTDLISVKQTLDIARYKIVDEKTMLIGANLLGENVTSGFYWKEIGIFAKDLDGTDHNEYLFSYDNCGAEASYIPSGGAVAEQLIDLNVTVGNSDNVTIEISSSLVYATADDLQNGLDGLESSLTTVINTNIASVTAALETHKNNTSNPHSVTKSQVGLDSVENYGIATENEAKAGSVNNKYMTPQRTKQAIDALGVGSDGNVIVKIQPTQPSPISGKTIIWINTSS